MTQIPLGPHLLNVFSTPEAASSHLADELTSLLAKPAVLGLATGSSPVPLYAELVRRHREGKLSFKKATTFNLDEYLNLPPDHPQSYQHFMATRLFDHIDLPPTQAHLPSGTNQDPEKAASAYAQKISAAGGLDWQLLGIGRNGHLGFNEPGSAADSPTRVVELHELTRQDAAPAFSGLENTPTHAITVGLRTILAAHRIVLVAWGKEKADILRQALTGPVTSEVPASHLQNHPNLSILVDDNLASAL